MLRHPQSLGRRHRALPARSRVQGAGVDQRGLRLRARPARRRGAARRDARASRGDRRRDRSAGECRFRRRLSPTSPRASPRACGSASTTGVAGLSIEDFDRRSRNPLYDFDLAVARVRAARAAIDKAGGDVLFTARSEGFIRGRPDLDETIRRLKAFADAGADCLYAPGIKTRDEIDAVVKAVAPKPVNFLMSAARLHGADLAAHGRAPHQPRRHARARRLERLHPLGARDRRARQVRQLRGVVPNAELNAFFRDDRQKRSS